MDRRILIETRYQHPGPGHVHIGNWSQFNQKMEYAAMLVVTQSEVVTAPPALGLLLEGKGVFAEVASDFSEAFWGDHNFIKLISSEKSTF